MRWSTVIHLLSLLIVPIHTVNILFYINVIGKSHLDFSDSLINSLVERGHSVDLIVARMNDKVKGNGKSKAKRIYSFGFPGESPWNKVPHMNDPFKDAHFAITGFRQYTLVGNELCDIAVADKGLHQFISEKKYDIGMISTFDYCGVGLLVKAGISSITTFNAVPMLPIQSVTIGLPNIASQFVPLFFSYDLSTLSGRFWNLICWGYINMIQIPTLRQEQTEIFHKQFGDMFDLEDALTRVDLAFINSNEIMEKPRPLNHRIQYIGGINLKSPKPLEKSFDAQLNRPGNGTVIFSFGTQVPSKVYPRYAVKNFVNVFKRFPGYTFLWKYEAQNEEEKKLFQSATNVFPTDWLPQTDLLYDKRVVGFITHAGLNSFVESSYAGKPMVAIPLFADQPHNSQNGIARGTTVVLNKAKLSEESIEAALRSILFDDSYTINAKKLSKMLVEKPAQPKSRFVEWMEYAAANPGLHKVFELPGSQMGIFEYYCVDAILLIATSLLTCCYIVYKLVTLVVAKKKLKTMRIFHSFILAPLHYLMKMHLTSILSLFVLNSLFLNAWPLRVLFYANIFAQTHMDYVDSLMNVLTDRGHTVDFVIIRINDNVIGNRKNNAERVYSLNFPGGSPWNNMSHLADPFKEEEFYYGNFRQWYNIAHQFCELAVNDENLIKFIGSEKYDIAITSKFDYCPIGMVSLFDIPSIVTSNPVPIQPVQAVMEGIPNPPATVAPVFQALDLSSFRNRFWNVMNWAYIHFIQNPEVKRIQEKIIQSQFGTNFSMDEAVSRVALAFVNSNEIMEKPRPLPHKVQYIGGINLKKPKKLSEEMNRLLELRTGRSGNGTVIFSFGTQVKPSVFPRYAVKNFVKVFKKFPGYTFLWKYEVQKGEERLFEEAENVYPLDWLPQTDLLNDPRVVGFISHVGLNSFNEASYAGKPIVAIPLFADQPHNADNGVLRGTTFRLDKTKLSEEQIERALRAILFDTSYLKNSQMLQKMLHEKPWQPKELFINWLEFAAQNPGLHKILELPGYNMGMIKYFCIDVVFYAILSTFIVSYLVWKLMSQFLGNIFEGITMMRKKKVQ